MSGETFSGLVSFLAVAAASMYFGGVKPLQNLNRNTNQKNTLHLPVIDLKNFFNRETDPAKYREECKKVADALHNYGLVIIKDPRVFDKDNNTFIDTLERYFALSDGKRDARPKLGFQVGVTPENTERARDFCKTFGAYGPDDKPLSVCPPELDPKWRFFWRIGPKPESTLFPALNADPVVPPEIPEWESVMNNWGEKVSLRTFYSKRCSNRLISYPNLL